MNPCDARCRGCDPLHLEAAASAAHKTGWLQRMLAPWAERLAPLQAVAPAERLAYRDRVRFAAARERDAWTIGLRTRDDAVIAAHACPVASTRVRATLHALRAALPPPEQFPLHYFVQTGAQVTLVVKCAHTPPLHWLDDLLCAQLAAAGVEGLWLHRFPGAGRHTFGKGGWQLLWGAPRSRDPLGLLHGPAAFTQVSPALYAASLDEAEAFLHPGAEDLVADLYCGRGASLRRWCARGARALGVESGGEAVECAHANAPGATVLRGLCAQRLPQLEQARRGHRGPLLAYVNPPRSGLEPAVRAWLLHARPARLAYLSCSAGTLARDLELLTAGGYGVERLTPYDFFPRTRHVETLALLRFRASPAPIPPA